MIRKRLAAAITLAVATLLGLVVSASPAQAGPPCDRPNPPPICTEEPPYVPGNPYGTAYFYQEETKWTVTGAAGEANGGAVLVDIKVDGVVRKTIGPDGAGYYRASLPADPAIGTVCVSVRNVNNVSLQVGCDGMNGPIGHVDITTIGNTTVLTGWVIDPDTTGPVTVRASFRTNYVADQARSDVANLYPGFGPYHGFTIVLPDTYCVDLAALNIGAGTDTLLNICLN